MKWVEEICGCTMRQKGPKLDKRKTPYHDGATGHALWNGNDSTDKETRTEDGKDGNKNAAICQGDNTKGQNQK